MIVILITACIILLILFMNFVYPRQSKSIKNKHVVVTGGSSGIGKSVAIEVAKRGAHVTIIARDQQKLNIAKEEIINACEDPLQQRVECVSLDVTNHIKVEEAMKEIDKYPVFMLVNCAGMAICGKLEDISQSDIKKLVDLNFLGTLYATKALVTSMKQRNEGVIVVTASQAALLGIFGFTIYSATKFALRGFAEALEMEVRPYNISVTLSLPPDTDTPGFENENKTKPKETFLISESGGLYSPKEIARNMVEDALIGKFYNYSGFESFMLSTLCCGMTPFISIFEVLLQALLLGPFRLISSFYILKFQRVVKECKNKKSD